MSRDTTRDEPRHESVSVGDHPRGGDVLIAHEPGDGSEGVAISVVPGGPQFRMASRRAAMQLLQPFAKKLGVDVWVVGDGPHPTRVIPGRHRAAQLAK